MVIIIGMSKVDELFESVLLNEESKVEKKRHFYPRKISNVGGLSDSFITALKNEKSRLEKKDDSINLPHIYKAIKWELER